MKHRLTPQTIICSYICHVNSFKIQTLSITSFDTKGQCDNAINSINSTNNDNDSTTNTILIINSYNVDVKRAAITSRNNINDAKEVDVVIQDVLIQLNVSSKGASTMSTASCIRQNFAT